VQDRFNFDEAIMDIKAGGGFAAYPSETLFRRKTAAEIKTSTPTYPGQKSYPVGGVKLLLKDGNHISKEAQVAELQSMQDATAIYMPDHLLGQWMHQYYANPDFLYSRLLIENIKRPMLGIDDNKKTLNLNAADRRTDNKIAYTEREEKIVKIVCKKVPSILIGILSYQTAHITYLQNMLYRIAQSTDLNDDEKKIGLSAVNNLEKEWRVNSFFMKRILPAIALHYFNAHGGSINNNIATLPEPLAAATQEDFANAMKFMSAGG
jgi:hypothetical protein